jgi:TonB family protein
MQNTNMSQGRECCGGVRAVMFVTILSVVCGGCRGDSSADGTIAPARSNGDVSVPAPLDLRGCPENHVAGVGGADKAPRLVRRVEPDYGKEPTVTGIIIVETVITRSGEVCAARVLRGIHPELDAAALLAIVQWQFVPAKKDGKPVQALFNISVPVRAP